MFRPSPFHVLTKAGGLLRYICVSARVVLKPSALLAVEWFKPRNCGNQDHSHVKCSFSYTHVIILATMLRTMSGHGPKPCMDLDFTHAIKTSGTMLKITRVCAVVTGLYCSCLVCVASSLVDNLMYPLLWGQPNVPLVGIILPFV